MIAGEVDGSKIGDVCLIKIFGAKWHLTSFPVIKERTNAL